MMNINVIINDLLLDDAKKILEMEKRFDCAFMKEKTKISSRIASNFVLNYERFWLGNNLKEISKLEDDFTKILNLFSQHTRLKIIAHLKKIEISDLRTKLQLKEYIKFTNKILKKVSRCKI